MKIVKVTDNLKVNIEQIYSLEKKTNEIDIYNWEDKYQDLLVTFSSDPPDFVIDDEIVKIKYGEINDEEKLQKYSEALDNHIINIIGEKPEYKETYILILATGLKINIPKSIYEAIDKILNEYIINKGES